MRLSDHDLLRRSFFTSNPLEEPNLVDAVPRGASLIGILSAYEHRAFKLPCAECGAARHYKGFVVELSNGKRTLLDNTCGRKLFGDTWETAGRIFRQMVDRQALLRRRARLLPVLPKLVAVARHWTIVLQEKAGLVQETRRDFPLLMERLREMVERADGRLTTERRIQGSDGAARIETVPLGRVAGAEAIMLPAHARRAEAAVQMLGKAQHLLAGDNIQTKTLEAELRAIADAVAALRDAAAAHNQLPAFFASANVQMIARWALGMPALQRVLVFKAGRLTTTRKETTIEQVEILHQRIRIRKPGRRNARQIAELHRAIAVARKAQKLRELAQARPRDFTFEERRTRERRPVTRERECLFPENMVVAPLDIAVLDALLPPP